MKRVLFVGVTAYNLDDRNVHLEKKFAGLSRNLDIFVVARGKPCYKRIWNTHFYLLPRPFYLPAAIMVSSYLCLFKKIDAVVCQGPLTEGIIGVFLKTLFRKELIVEIHGDWREGPFVNKKRPFAWALRKIVSLIGRLSLSRADKIRTLTYIAKSEIEPHFSNKQFFVFPTFTDIDIFLSEKNTSFQKYICTAAVLSPIKNIETLVDAFAIIHNKFSDFKLVIAGDGPSRDELKAKSYKQKAGRSIIFTGRLSQEEVKYVMKDCYVFVLPSLSEGFGRVFIEAMALGKPAIGSNVGGVPEIIKDGENGFLIEPKDTQALALKIEELIIKPMLAHKMGEAGRKFVQENFSNAKYIKNYVDMIYK